MRWNFSWRNVLSSFTLGLISSSARVRRSAARGLKSKTFTPKFLENGQADRRHFGAVDRAHRADENPGMLVSYLLGLGVGCPQRWPFRISKTVLTTPYFITLTETEADLMKKGEKNLGVLIDFSTFWGSKTLRAIFPHFCVPTPKIFNM